MQSSQLPPLAPWETCYPAALLCVFHWGRSVPHYVAVSVSAESSMIPPVPWGFGLWAQFCEVLAIVFGAAEEETRHLRYPVPVSAGNSVCSGFWWLFFYCYFCFTYFTEELFLALYQIEYKTRTLSFICRKSLFGIRRVTDMKSYW